MKEGAQSELESRLLQRLDDGFSRVQSRAGGHLLCAAGCSDCCSGPFPITRLDAERLRRGLQQLDRGQPEVARRLRARVASWVEAMRPDFPGEVTDGRLAAGPAELDAYFGDHAKRPCPVLHPVSGRCELYAHRPVACRHYGPPLRFDGRNVSPCSLCFKHASEGEVEACRWDPDPDGIEGQLLTELGVELGDEWETLIGFALEAR
jgi:Fe-S-cluster containining protein